MSKPKIIFENNKISKLKPIGYRRIPKTWSINTTKEHAWFTFDAKGHFQPAVLAVRVEMKTMVYDIPRDTPLVLIIRPDQEKEVALVAYTCIFTAHEFGGNSLFNFKGHFSKEEITLREDQIIKIYKPIGWMMDSRNENYMLSDKSHNQ
jgi:hypothetical protein